MSQAIILDQAPRSVSWDFQAPPEDSIIFMEFRLVYRGPLPSASNSNSRSKEKHDIRKQLHQQLSRYWNEHPHLRMLLRSGAGLGDANNPVAQLSKKFNRGNHNFVPLVREQDEMYCSVDILFLRRDPPGRIVQGGGDLDNRLKTLFDALQVPKDTSGLPNEPETGFDPIFCLLQDDSQITTIHVTTDRLLGPWDPNKERESDVLLVMHMHVYRGTNVAQVTGLPGSA